MQHDSISTAKPKPASGRTLWIWLQRGIVAWQDPLVCAPLALLIYTLVALQHGPIGQPSLFAYYNYLADALLHGQLALRLTPPTSYDMSLFQGRYYLYWPPFPALLLLPLVAIFGVGLSDIVVTLIIGALNVGLVAVLLRQAQRAGVIDLSPLQRALLVIFFAFGTVHITLAAHGRVWFTGQLIGFSCLALAYLAALRLRGAWAFAATGAALACALLTRNHLLLAGLWPGCYLLWRYWPLRWPRLLGYTLAGAVPVVLALLLLGIYNALRFGSPLDNGLAYHQMGQIFRADYARYGAFNLHYLPTNLYYQYLAYPFPIRPESYQGGSLFLLSPLFFAALWGPAYARPRWSGWLLLATVMLVNLPILLLMGTGWIQFGPRYTLDFTLPLLLLTALGMRRWPTWLNVLLIGIAVVSYSTGALALGQFLRFL